MYKLPLVLAVLAFLAACGTDDDAATLDTNPPDSPDTDGDGLTDAQEDEAGTDPSDDDSDDDRLMDGDEAANGADPKAYDTDQDGYADGDEVAEGTDPADPESRIYDGGWPYYWDKGSIEAGDFDSPARAGDPVPHFVGIDQYGDEVDIYDYAYTGKPIIVDISAVWCGPCNQMANWLSHGEDWGTGWDDLREKLDNGDFYWVTLLYQNRTYGEADADVVAAWDEDYPSDRVMVVTDPGSQLSMHINPPGIPSLSLIGDDMTWMVVDDTTTAANTVLRDY